MKLRGLVCGASWIMLASACDIAGAKGDHDKSDGDKTAEAKGSDSAHSSGSSASLGTASAMTAKPPASAPPGSQTAVPTPATPVVSDGSAFAHVAADCELAITSDLTKVRAQSAFAKDVLPKLDAILAAKPKDEKMKAALEFVKAIGLNTRSPQSAALCARGFSTADKPSFGVLLGTDLKPGAFVSSIEKFSKGSSVLTDVGGVKVVSSPKAVIGQLTDGPFEVADREEAFKSLIAPSDGVTKLGLETTKELSFYANESFIKKELRKPGSKMAEAFEDVTEIHGNVDLSTNKAHARLTCTSSIAAFKLAAGIALLKDDIAKDEKLSKNPFGAADVIRSAEATTDGSDVLVDATIPATSVDQVAATLAKELEAIQKKL